MAVPVYLFTGFLESGKTTLIKNTLLDEGFNDGEKTLLIRCEEGVEEYEEKMLKDTHTILVNVESASYLCADLLVEFDRRYEPDRVMIEYNGMWSVNDLLDMEMPLDWLLVQILTTIDATTFTTYMSNMRSIMYDQLFASEVVIFNRCEPEMKKSFLRSNIKAINKSAQLIYEMSDGSINDLKDDELPFDVNASFIDLEDDDYGLWYMDALENPGKYRGKTIRFKGKVMRRPSDDEDIYVIGRLAMVCCADDMQLIGLMVKSNHAQQMVDGDWLILTASVEVVYDDEYGGNVPFLIEDSYERCRPMKDEIVSFS